MSQPIPEAPTPAQLDECFRCGYDLRGIANDQPCPECGLLAERSRRMSDELHDTRPRWLRSISRGVWSILLAIVLGSLWPFTFSYLYRWSYRAQTLLGIRDWIETIISGGFALAAMMLIVGAFQLTAKEGYAPADRADRRRRIALRVAAFVPLLGILLAYTVQQLYWGYYWSIASMSLIRLAYRSHVMFLPLLFTVGCAPLPLLLFYHLRSLANRAHSAHLAEHCAIVGIGTMFALLYLSGVVFVFQLLSLREPHWQSRSDLALIILLIACVAGVLFILWSLYLLIRFAVSFHLAARQMKHKWRRDDRAQPDAASAGSLQLPARES
jgi:hypothetical protein